MKRAKGRTYKVGEVAAAAKVTVRALHYYDSIGLLQPSGRSHAGYRLYTDDDVARLQHIRFYRELGMSLEDIAGVLDADDFDSARALREHRQRLEERVREAEDLMVTIDRTLAELQGEKSMSAEEHFHGFQPEEYAAEAKERWGHTDAYKQSQQRVAGFSKDDWKAMEAEAEGIVADFAACREAGHAASADEALAIAERHRQHIGRYYDCSHAMHAALADMYVNDERFAAYFDRHGEGLSDYVAAAIQGNAAAAATGR